MRSVGSLLAGAMLLVAGCAQHEQPADSAATKKSETSTKAAVVPEVPKGPASVVKVELGENVSLEVVLIKPGSFMMGSPTSEAHRDADETEHKVTLTKPYYVGKYEVTQGQWKAVMGGTITGAEDLPASGMSWDEAVTFCEKLGAKSGKKFRLPTEAEWEYACRAGSSGPYQGAAKVEEVAWPADQSAGVHPVGKKKANAWGLYDMLGNVWEWCSDGTADYPGGEVTDPMGPGGGGGGGGAHIDRGGSWGDDTVDSLRSANRGRSSSQGPRIGMRVVMEVG